MLPRPCAVCGRPSRASRCAVHPRERHTDSAAARGYDSAYTAERRRIMAEVRTVLLAGGIVPCVICRRAIASLSELSIEHVRPLRHGGDSSPANLAAAHRACNYGWRHKRR